MRQQLRLYYQLAKPGIIYGNLLTAAAGFVFASRLRIDPWLLLATLAGTALVIGGACACNNYIDRDLDVHMERTKRRALVQGTISTWAALVYSAALTLAGFTLLTLGTNWPTVVLGAIGFIDYVAAYGITKRLSPLGTLVGSVAGAMPIMAGYVAVVGRIDSTALLLFLIMAIWQMPHFYAIAMYRRRDYAAAGVPVLSVRRGMHASKVRIVVYVIGFAAACMLLSALGRAGWTFGLVMSAVSAIWLMKGLRGFTSRPDEPWARAMFGYSLLAMLALSIVLPAGAFLP